MILENNTTNWIHIEDINVSVPPRNRDGGKVHVENGDFYRSHHIASLIESGQLKAPVLINECIIRGMHNGVFSYSVPSHNIWGEGKDVVRLKNSERDESDGTEPLYCPNIKKKVKRRYRVRKNVPGFSVSLDSINKVLSKHMPEITLEESEYYDTDVQKAVISESVEVVEILEETTDDDGKKGWKTVRSKDDHSVDSMLAPKGSKCVHWEGPVFDGGGYAQMNRQMIFNLEEMGWSVKPTIVSTNMHVEMPVRERIYNLSNNMIPAQSPKVFGTTLPSHHHGKSIAYTMIETENRISPFMSNQLRVADEIWTPSEWNRRLFRDSGVKGDIRVMPLGVDHEIYRPEERSLYYGGGTNGFTFLSVFQWNWRKGPDVMLKAYIRAFSSRDDVSMVMISRYIIQNESMTQNIISEINEWTAGERQHDRPHLALVDRVMPTYLMPKLYNSADAFCLFSRGEGWGLPYCEAAASGMPIVGADHGGQQMFLNDDYATLVRPDTVSKCEKFLETVCYFYKDMEFVDYSDRAIDEIAEKMRWAYENRDQIEEKAIACRSNILNNFTWRHAAERVADRLSDLQP